MVVKFLKRILIAILEFVGIDITVFNTVMKILLFLVSSVVTLIVVLLVITIIKKVTK